MARIPEEELERLKREVDLVALVRSKGIELKPHGSKDLAGLSPFSKEKTPSFIVTPAKNLWHCMSSGQGGSVIDFVMKHDGVSFRHAVELLRDGKVARLVSSNGHTRKATVPKLESPVAYDADERSLFEQVLGYYRERLTANPAAVEYLAGRGLTAEAVETFGIGFADRTLGLRLPQKNRKSGAAIRERLTKLGLYGRAATNTSADAWSSRSGTSKDTFPRSTAARSFSGKAREFTTFTCPGRLSAVPAQAGIGGSSTPGAWNRLKSS